MAKRWDEVGRKARGKPTEKLRFTVKNIAAIPVPESGRVQIYDSGTKGLGVRIEASGRKVYFWQRKMDHAAQYRTIGLTDEVTLEAAIGTADKWNGWLSEWKRHGFKPEEDPFPEAQGGELTLDQLLEKYIEKRIRRKAVNPPKAEYENRWMLKAYLSHFRNRKLSQIKRQHVRELHDKLTRECGSKKGIKKGIMADRVVEFVRRIYNWAAAEELWTGENPAARIATNGDNKVDRFLAPDEYVRLEDCLATDKNQNLHDFVVLALELGIRSGNILGMRWEWVNEEMETLTLPRLHTKNKKPQVVALVPRALAILKRRRHLRALGPWVFPSKKGKSGHLVAIRNQVIELLKRANIETKGENKFTPHSMRRTNASYSALAGRSLQQIAQTLGHSDVSSTQIYARLNSDAARATLAAGSDMREKLMAAAREKLKASAGA